VSWWWRSPHPAVGTATGLTELSAVVETAPNFDDEAGGDADADDPAIWVHPSRPDRWRVQFRVYAVDPRGASAGQRVLTDVTAPDAALAFSRDAAEVEDQHTAYGLAVYGDPAGGAPWVAVSRRSETRIGLFRLVPAADGRISYSRAALDLPAAFQLSDGSRWSPCGEPGDGPHAEGLTIAYRGTNRTPLASSQGDSTFATYRIEGHGQTYRGGFRVVDGPAIDRVQHSDGAAVTTQAVGPRFPYGLLAVHDGENTPGDSDRENTTSSWGRLEIGTEL
jgi:myo-inositol-hexaphosphate 3-phosphohydrolase